ncbi:helix-turn-helix domain-containing protein [Ohessyouella blattaphilus]|uniref:LuxR C-terminal-related transcriptional regulator n=1 Tax=Ohessyouella blattaphilus TaxID=2949333 RepID=A0ABT1EIC7_9FIRM|nr:LuxR C-terminal-related transcriptional regulator [Ohessyouella blattaphilus]MCP1110460.1 LuxR C-terminal-related transcriptional regulator [Ohessyouella blattaphilus]MCR8563854.1 LuxR C-terminal-related transcriptional regulator [Ohessyouella blattaphilus]
MRIFKQYTKAKLYFSPRIKNLITRSKEYPVTILESPTGFGKSTAIKGFIAAKKVKNAFFMATNGGAEENWQRLICLFREVNPVFAGEAINIEVADNDSIGDLAALLQKSACKEPTYLIIDNFEQIQGEFHEDFVRALSKHEDENLHFIVCTRSLEGIRILPADKQNVLIISHEELRLNEEETKLYLEENHIHLTPAELSEVVTYTNGWFEAINMQRLHFLNTHTFGLSEDLKELIQTVIWETITPPERRGLLGLSLLDSFSLEQAVRILDFPFDETEVEKLLRLKEFIQKDSGTGRYHFDYILADFLSTTLQALKRDARNFIVNHVAEVCRETGEVDKAFTLYQDNGNYAQLLELCLNVQDFSTFQSKELMVRLERVLREGDHDLLLKHPQALLNMALPLFLVGRESLSKECVSLVEEGITKHLYGHQDDLLGQIMFIRIFDSFNDLDLMTRYAGEAQHLLKGKAKMFGEGDSKWSWLLGQTSVIHLYWTKNYSLLETIQKLEYFLSLYVPLTGRRGSSALQVLKAERELVRGKLEEAEIYSYEARYLAKSHGQIDMYISANTKLLRIALLKGDAKQFLEIKKDMEKAGEETTRVDIHQMIEGAVNCEPESGLMDHLPRWMRLLDQEKNLQSYAAAPFYMIAHLKWLLSIGENLKVIGLANGALPQVVQHNFLFAQIHYLVFKGIAYKRLGNRKEYEACLKEAYAYALPDEVYYPFAEMGEELHQDYIRFVDRETAVKLQAFYKRFKENGEIIAEAMGGRETSLSDREKEVAHLAKQGMTNKEIATQLLISAETVKVLLKRGFVKLGINSRKELKYIESL